MFEELKKRLQSTESVVSLILGVAVVLVVGAVIVNTLKNKGVLPGSPEQKKETSGTSTGPISSPTTYTVVAGDTLWGICETYYKTGYNWKQLAEANAIVNPNHIEVGQQLTIPVLTPIFPPGQVDAGITDKKPEQKSYTIVTGDTLWDIAVAQYGNGFRWGDIAKANNLPNPNLIYPGSVLTLP
ncbi:LysM peptidoglycan-binding domain-containing protein [Candidatus Gottesmanbacteria bacterium]|nr:LysM peptidoglycan-binding domain-containing protein [Candidatus Gottesmanbacteria bacterium]